MPLHSTGWHMKEIPRKSSKCALLINIQHNPDVADGFITYFERMQEEYPKKKIEFVRCIAEGDLLALHPHQTWLGQDQYVTMDFFRFDKNGKS